MVPSHCPVLHHWRAPVVVVQRTMLNEEVEMECCWPQQSKKNEISDVAVVKPSPHGSVCDAELGDEAVVARAMQAILLEFQLAAAEPDSCAAV